MFSDRAASTRQFVAAVANVVEVAEAAYVSKERVKRTTTDRPGRRRTADVESAADLRQHVRKIGRAHV